MYHEVHVCLMFHPVHSKETCNIRLEIHVIRQALEQAKRFKVLIHICLMYPQVHS